MARKSIIGLVVVVGLLAVGSYALAHGPGYGGGWGMGYGMSGYGPGHMMGWYGNGEGYAATSKIRGELYAKQAELDEVLSAPTVDEARAKALQTEINTLRNQAADESLAAGLKERRENPNADRTYGPGYGRGPGAGYCWR
ncbi:MAG: hypothetical protein KKB20_21470 [Proteobacteria bacterium]|nr:hypothetical protein [Pseudomonadota bacterium]